MKKIFHKLDFTKLKWIYFISKRFSKVDRKNKGHATTTLASVGICFGVMSLIVVMSVMNGFQMTFIDSILELSSYHIQVSGISKKVDSNLQKDFISWTNEKSDIISVTPYMEAQGLFVGLSTKQGAGIIRGLNPNSIYSDSGFNKELKIISGSFNLIEEDSIVLGNDLARVLGARIGSVVNIAALSGSNDVSLLSENRKFTVKGIFKCGYGDINSTYAFIPLSAAEKYFGNTATVSYGIKVKKYNFSENLVPFIKKYLDEYSSKCINEGLFSENDFSSVSVNSWKNYNRSFFGTLRVEKNILLLLVLLIFIVVAVNIYNGMRRMVFERSQEIAVLQALGASKNNVLQVFMVKGFTTGLNGAVPGTVLGLLISHNMDVVFSIISNVYYYVQLFFTKIFNPSAAQYVTENPMFRLYGNIEARIIPGEVLMIFMFGLFASFIASFFAGKKIMTMTVSEVLRNE